MVTNNGQNKGVNDIGYEAWMAGKDTGFFASQIKGMEFEFDDVDVNNDPKGSNHSYSHQDDASKANTPQTYAHFEERFGASVQHYVSWYQSHHPNSTPEHAFGFLEQMVAKTLLTLSNKHSCLIL